MVLEHCVTYAYHVLRGKPRDGMGICHDFDRSISYIIYHISCAYIVFNSNNNNNLIIILITIIMIIITIIIINIYIYIYVII